MGGHKLSGHVELALDVRVHRGNIGTARGWRVRLPVEILAGHTPVERLPKCGSSNSGRAVFCFHTKETALLHANFAMDSIPHSLQAFLMIAGGIIGLLAAFSLVDSSTADAPASQEVRSAENRVESGERVPVERPGRRY